jgi:hypothetical protein
LLSYIKSFPDVWMATHLDVAEEWRRMQTDRGTWDSPDAAPVATAA